MADFPYNLKAWARLRRLKLNLAPLCEPCAARGKNVVANVVDHVIAISMGGDPFPPLSGLRSMCQACHNAKTRNVEKAGGSGLETHGIGADGFPVDPKHPAYAGDPDNAPNAAFIVTIPPERTGI